jgi:subtilisin family serine protease
MRLARPVLIPGYLIAVAALLTTGCVGALKQTQTPAESGQGIPKQLQERQVIVTLALATRERWAGITRALGMEYALGEVGAFPLNSIGVQCVVFQIPADRPVDAVIRQLAADPRVETVQPNQVFKGLRAIHTDPYAALQYGAGVIRAEMAHHRSTGRGVKVAVVDTGVDKEHPDLRGRIVQTANFVEGGERSFTQDRHGTAVAGVIGARAEMGSGSSGLPRRPTYWR